MKKQQGAKFEQVFLERAFECSMDDDLASTGRMLRALKGLLVQTKVKKTVDQSKDSPHNTREYLDELAKLEAKPIKGIDADIHQVCRWIALGKSRVILWDAHKRKPVKALSGSGMVLAMRDIEDRLNVIAGELCEVLNVEVLNIGGVKQVGWPKARGAAGGGTRADAG